MRTHALAASWAAAVLTGACAYYNGLYNANHLAADAARARREGRPAEARSLWEQAAIKAESVAVRHPRSRYRDRARLLQGESLREAGACARAIEPLSLVADSGRRAEDRSRAALWLGACYLDAGAPGPARATLTPLIEGPNPVIGQAARLWRARAAVAAGDPAAALEDLEPLSSAEAVFERAGALSLLGRHHAAAAQLRAVSGEFDEARWHRALALLGPARPDLAAGLTDRVLGDPGTPAGAKARLLVAEGDRWAAAGDQQQAQQRLEQAVATAPDSQAGRTAAARLAVMRLRGASRRDDVAAITAELARAVDDGGPAARVAEPALRVLRRVTAARESRPPDLHLFLAAEAVRDDLQAPNLAEVLFVEIAREYPSSPVAPKALLAAAALGSAARDSLLAAADAQYADSPYVLAARGGAVQYPPSEDSLRALATRNVLAETAGPRPGMRPPSGEEEIRKPTPSPPPRGRAPEP